MKVVLTIVIYNRFANLQTWVECWEKSAGGAELVVIHNHYGDEELRDKFHNFCTFNNIRYIGRNGPGFDIGAMQDVFAGRLKGMPDWDLLLWATDDVLPMTRDFISPFVNAMVPGVGIACMQLSKSVSHHVRTTGFMISKEVAKRIKFPADPVKTKQQCYYLEHRGGKETLTNQVRAMGLDCVQVAPISQSPLWDSQHPNASLRLDRQAGFNHTWGIRPSKDKVVVICPIFDAYPQIISSMICQTHKNWELLLIDDNPDSVKCEPLVAIENDERIKYIKRPRMAKYGHPHRQWALKELDTLSDAQFVCVTNGDNYYTPAFIDSMLIGFGNNKSTQVCYCEAMVHSYIGWGVINCSFKLGFLDCGGAVVRRQAAMEVGWRDIDSHSSDFTYFSDIMKLHGAESFVKVKGTLFIHNVIVFIMLLTIGF